MENSLLFDVEQFIKEVKYRPVLWDSKHPNYNHRQAKTSAWEEVALNLYADSENWSNYDKFGKVRDIQKRWKNMRDNYIKEIKYEMKVDQGLALPKKKRYIYADQMDFLKPRKKPPSKCSSVRSSSEDDDEEMDAETNKKASDSYALMDEGYSSSHVNQFCNVIFGSQSDHNPEQNSQRSSTESSNNANVKPRRNIPDPNSHAEYTSSQFSHRNFSDFQSHSDLANLNASHKNAQVTQPSSSRVAPSTDLNLDSSSVILEQDDDKMFLLSLLPYFKKFSEKRKLQARIKVSQLLHELLYNES